MSAVVPAKPALPPQAASPAERLAGRLGLMGGNRVDKEFLPAHLEVLDTPPSPVSIVLLWTVSAFFAALLLWSVLARIDIFATAQGRVQPTGRSKVVQPTETGRVRSVDVVNGARVSAGQVLMTLDASEAVADDGAKRADLGSYDAQVARRRAAISAISGDAARPPEPEFTHSASPAVEEQERSAMRSDVDQYAKARDAILAQVAENEATQGRLAGSIAARERLLSILRERAAMKQALVDRSSGTRAAVLDATQQVEQSSADLAYDKGTLAETRAALGTLRGKVASLRSDSLGKQETALAEAMERRAVAVHEVMKTSLRKDRMTVTSPVDGTVQQVAVRGVGQVVTAGQPVMVVVPTDGPIEIEALVPSRDIGFVVPGQKAVVKLDAFPFTRYGALDGEVLAVSRDAVSEREAGAAADAVTAGKGGAISAQSGISDVQGLVYPVTVRLSRTSIAADGRDVPLAPGMTATVEVRTGDRRVVDYLLSPLSETTQTAGHER